LKIIEVNKIVGKISKPIKFPWFFYNKVHPDKGEMTRKHGSYTIQGKGVDYSNDYIEYWDP
jgi:hypothetical protein